MSGSGETSVHIYVSDHEPKFSFKISFIVSTCALGTKYYPNVFTIRLSTFRETTVKLGKKRVLTVRITSTTEIL